MSIHLLCLVLAAISFLLKALSVNLGRIDLMNLGFFFVVLAFIL